jgi:hypothetical protein
LPQHFLSRFFPLEIIRLFDWFVIGQKKNRERSPAAKPPLAELYCTKLKYLGKLMIINKILAEATGVELITLTARKLLIPGTATTAKKAPLPNPLYVCCTKNAFRFGSRGPCCDHSIP